MKKWLETICIIILVFFMQGCSLGQNNINNQENNKKHEYQLISHQSLSSVIAISKVGSNYQINNIQSDYSLKKVGDLKGIADFKYSNDKNIYVSTIINNSDKNSYNKLIIQNKDSVKELNELFYYSDIKMSKNSTKIAYRSFQDKSCTIPEGMQIYDIEKMCKIKRNSRVLVSGNIYEWLDDDNLLYYGVIPGVNNSAKIYKYSVKESKEEVYFDKLDDYCKYFFPIGNRGLIILENSLDDYKLYYYDFKTDKKQLLSQLISEIKNIKLDINRNKLYFIAKIAEQNKYYVYQFNLNDLSLFRITYDFPNYVYSDGGLAIDKKGNLLFVGYNDNVVEKDIYLFEPDTNTISLISENSSNYRILSSND